MRNVDGYVKVLSLAALVGIVYWRDLTVLLSTAFSIRWIGFTLAIIPLAFLFLFQKRKAVDMFATIPESKYAWEIVLIILAIILYTFGSYSEYALWFHVSSLVVFVVAYLMLRIDFRVSKIALLPTTALAIMSLWVIPSTINIGITATVIVYFVSLVYIAFLLITVLLSSSGQVSARELCVFYQSNRATKETFCPHCGKQRSALIKPSSTRLAITKFAILLTIVTILVFIFVPVLVLADDGPNVTLHIAHGPDALPIIETPQGWVVESSTRLLGYESEHFEDFAVLNRYAEKRYAENKSYILLEISWTEQWPYWMNSWQIEGWNRTREGEVVLADNIIGQYVKLKRQDYTVIVLYNPTPIRLLFKTGLSFETKNVGLSIFMNLTNFDESKTPQVREQLRNMGEPIIRRWIDLNRWTNHALTLTRLYTQFKDIFFTVIGVVGVFSFAGWARTTDNRKTQIIEKTLSLPRDEALLFAVGAKARAGLTGAELFNAYKRLTKIDVNRFHKKLDRLVKLGLMEKHYKLKNREVLLTWKTAI